MAIDPKQSQIEKELESQQEAAFRAIRTSLLENMPWHFRKHDKGDLPSLELLGKLIKELESDVNAAKQIITQRFAQRVVKNAYREREENINDKGIKLLKTKTNKIRSLKMNNRNRKNWTATDRTKLARMYGSGRLSVEQIANRLGRTYFATIKKAERMGIRSIRLSRSLRKSNAIHNALH